MDQQEAINEFACHTSEKSRRQDGYTAHVIVFVRTSPLDAKEAQYPKSAVFPLKTPTSDCREITEAAFALLDAIYLLGFSYAKAEVMLLDIQSAERHQLMLDLSSPIEEQGDAGQSVAEGQTLDRTRLMMALDQVNGR